MIYDEFDSLIEDQEEGADDDTETEEVEEPKDDAPDDEDSEME